MLHKINETICCLESDTKNTSISQFVHSYHEQCIAEYIAINSTNDNLGCIICNKTGKLIKLSNDTNLLRLGIDIGGVIIHRSEGEDTSFFGGNFLQTPAEPDCFESIKKLVDMFGSENVFIVSKCGKTIQEKSLQWLEYYKFFEITGMRKINVHFTEKREEKAVVCQQFLITHFIDDRTDVMKFLMQCPTIKHYYLYNPEPVQQQNFFVYYLPELCKVKNWLAVLTQINHDFTDNIISSSKY